MPYCQGASKAQIKFKYQTNSNWQIFNSDFPPVDYSLVNGTCTGCSSAKSYYAIGNVIADRTSTSPLCRGTSPTTTIPAGSFFCIRDLAPGQPRAEGCTHNSCCDTLREELRINCRYAGQAINWTFSGNYVLASCKFTITDTRGLVYQSFNPTCPIVEVVCGNTCPPETVCECDCGTEICCYGPDGKPIFSYPK
ncbi:MAG: hypothetical protein ACRC11_01050 [Xenococcaceae cyanobacterium]